MGKHHGIWMFLGLNFHFRPKNQAHKNPAILNQYVFCLRQLIFRERASEVIILFNPSLIHRKIKYRTKILLQMASYIIIKIQDFCSFIAQVL